MSKYLQQIIVFKAGLSHVGCKNHSPSSPTQVTLNNVEVCSENITTLKRNLEVGLCHSSSFLLFIVLFIFFSPEIKKNYIFFPVRTTAPSCSVRGSALESKPRLRAVCPTLSARPQSSKIYYRLDVHADTHTHTPHACLHRLVYFLNWSGSLRMENCC